MDYKSTAFSLSLATCVSQWFVPCFKEHLYMINSNTVLLHAPLAVGGTALKLCGLDREQATR